MTHPPSDLLSAYLDGELHPERRSALERHLADCPRCRTISQDLATLIDGLGRLEDCPPSVDHWPSITLELTPRRQHWRPVGLRRTTAWQLAAALVTLSLGVGWWLVQSGRGDVSSATAHRQPATPAAAGAGRTGEAFTTPPGDPVADYDQAIRDLEAVFASSRNQLDPRLRAAIERDAATFATAVGDLRTALDADPDDAWLRQQLLAMLGQQWSWWQTWSHHLTEGRA